MVYEEDGQEKTMTVSFDATAPDGTYAISRVAGQSMVTINLGQKVAVKKVTITVTKVEGQTGDKPQFATVTQIEFLKDIVSDNTPADTQVKNVTAVASDGEVSLSWQAVNNVTGYTVKYGTAKGSLTQSVAVSTNKATVSGLKNNQTYYFQVMATNGRLDRSALGGDLRGSPARQRPRRSLQSGGGEGGHRPAPELGQY